MGRTKQYADRVNVIKRIKVDGRWPFAPVVEKNGKIVRDHVRISGRDEHHPEGRYYLEWYQNGRRRRQAAGEFDEAVARARLKSIEIQAVRAGLVELPEAEPTPQETRTKTAKALQKYLEFVQTHRSPRTYLTYRFTLDTLLRASYSKAFFDEVNRDDILKFIADCYERGLGGHTVYDKLVVILQFFKWFGQTKQETVTVTEKIEKMGVGDDAIDLVFRKARTYNAWLPKPVSDKLIHQLYDTLKWGPTSANISPARFVFLRSAAAKERLRLSLAPGNVEKTMTAPVTVIVAYDLKFYEKLPRLFPHYLAMRDMFVNNPQLIEETARRNSALQGAYMIIAARALGLDCGPMSGFDNLKLDEEFFSTGKCEECEQEFFPAGHVKSNFLCNMGYGDPAKLMPRGPRLAFNEACTLF